MTKPTTKVALAAVTKLQERLGQVPTHQADEVSKQRAIGLLVPQLLEMHAKGYTWRAIASLLSDEGLTVTPTALQGYVRRSRFQVAPTSRSRQGRRPPKTSGPPSPPLPPAAGARTSAPAAAQGPTESPRPTPSPPTPSAPPADSTPRRASITPKRENDES